MRCPAGGHNWMEPVRVCSFSITSIVKHMVLQLQQTNRGHAMMHLNDHFDPLAPGTFMLPCGMPVGYHIHRNDFRLSQLGTAPPYFGTQDRENSFVMKRSHYKPLGANKLM